MTAGSIPAQDKITREKQRQDKVEDRSAAITAIRQWSLIKEGNSFKSGTSSFSSSSSRILQASHRRAAEGQKLKEYRIPVFLLTHERSLGPNPTENSTTAIPFNRARR